MLNESYSFDLASTEPSPIIMKPRIQDVTMEPLKMIEATSTCRPVAAKMMAKQIMSDNAIDPIIRKVIHVISFGIDSLIYPRIVLRLKKKKIRCMQYNFYM